ncbi:Uncharacterised protein [Mycobacteroides abscessus subsp. bolletii]|nr:Uncharacterised protein [Mycobacteroides abscessus subsp. bolletii]SHS10320.1 Uncharacterised protein [Mycobacteroides abscessus subsp. bolletii]SHS80823.1 Uncharacterised protein [Mycobacteroides abscessus subsp. bolletii]SHS84545.1 Uncharacterised protein [Mycobacteroides abscessus subsp. bolletii]SHX73548.1 Uncharacterised protein [Mycobacteroides abscessus subsp. bolletii]
METSWQRMRAPRRWESNRDNTVEDSGPTMADYFRYELTTTVEYRKTVTFEQWLENHADYPC